MLVCLFGISDYFLMDLLKFKVSMKVAVTAILYGTEKEKKRIRFYYVCMIIGFFAIITGIRRYLVIIATFFSVIQCIDWINISMAERVLEIDSVFRIIVNYSGLLYIAIGLWLVTALAYLLNYKTKKNKAISDYKESIGGEVYC